MKKILIPLIIIILVAIGVLYYIFIYKEEPKDNNNEQKVNEVTAGIYKLNSNPTKYQKEIFNELKDILKSDNYEEQTLAESIVKNFILEFYTLSNVDSKDVRGTQYVAEELKNRFITFGSDVYNYYAYYTNKKDLEVKSIEITDTDNITYDYKDDLGEIASKDNLNGYKITTNWKYKDNTEYKTIVTIVKWNENYSIISVENEE